jgi:hypothetical protein
MPMANSAARSATRRAGVLAQVAQELELRGDDPVPLAETVVEVVVEARLAADQVGEEAREVELVVTLV